MSLNPGTKLGPYEILEPIGAGGMGEVYRARDTKLGREVAIKALPEAFAQNEERLARFEREARLLASLNHPNIATLFGLERSDGVRFLVMELAEGETLGEPIRLICPRLFDPGRARCVHLMENPGNGPSFLPDDELWIDSAGPDKAPKMSTFTVPDPLCRGEGIHSGNAGFHRLLRLWTSLARPGSISSGGMSVPYRGADRGSALE